MPGVVEQIHIVPVKRGPPQAVAETRLTPGRSLPGDHHDRPGIKRPVTMIRAETLDAVAAALGRDIPAGASRRNLTIRGLDLDALPKGARLQVGEAEIEVLGPCDPCSRMEKAIGPGALARMEGKGGLVVKVVRAGTVRVGDRVEPPKAAESVDPARAEELQRALVGWFRRVQRDLPWRRTKDPYAVWISEVMLQQTQVSTVIPHYERFLQRFPDVRALAEAPVDDVLALWSGLGYYARARNLHRAAQAVVERHGGVFPANLEALRALPGFGPYTAGAVGSIALGLDAALVDGNVARVFCRLEGWQLGSEEAREKSWELAPALVPHGEAGDWNQALMELGATVCTPVNPRCDGCPARALCGAAKAGDPATYPLPKERRARKALRLVALAVRQEEAVLLLRREGKGLFGGLWELPSEEIDATADAQGAALLQAKRLFARGAAVEQVAQVRAQLTHRDVTVEVFAAQGAGVRVPEEARFVLPEAIAQLGMSSLGAKVLRAAHVPVPEGHARRRKVDTSQRSLF